MIHELILIASIPGPHNHFWSLDFARPIQSCSTRKLEWVTKGSFSKSLSKVRIGNGANQLHPEKLSQNHRDL